MTIKPKPQRFWLDCQFICSLRSQKKKEKRKKKNEGREHPHPIVNISFTSIKSDYPSVALGDSSPHKGRHLLVGIVWVEGVTHEPA